MLFSARAVERFKRSYVERDGCWEWTQQTEKGRFPYGRFMFRGKQYMAHRASWMLHFGDIAPGLFVCHRCDNPRCVNPSHLFLGTPLDNVRDMQAKGRHRKPVVPSGERHYSAKLSDADVEQIIKRINAGFRQHFIATEFGVGQDVISRIKNGKTRKAITAPLVVASREMDDVFNRTRR